jgi:hypothetical protein
MCNETPIVLRRRNLRLHQASVVNLLNLTEASA